MNSFFYFFIIFILIFNLNGIFAVGFSPTSLIFNLNKDEENCQIITLSSDSEKIYVSDKWSENSNVEWKVDLFDKDASYHGLSVNYDNLLIKNEKEVKVCLSGKNDGEFHGILLLKQEQKGNSIIQMGVWLKAVIGEGFESQNKINNEISKKLAESSQETEIIPSKENIETKKSESVKELSKTEENSVITGAVIGTGNKNWKIIAAVLIIIFVAIIAIYIKNKREVYA